MNLNNFESYINGKILQALGSNIFYRGLHV